MMGKRTKDWQGMNWVRSSTRLAVYLRDGLACVYCGRTLEEGVSKLTLDHLRPVSKGGTNHPSNLVTCCHRCNAVRGDTCVRAFCHTVSNCLDGRFDSFEIERHVRNSSRRVLPRVLARQILKRRGSFRQALEMCYAETGI